MRGQGEQAFGRCAWLDPAGNEPPYDGFGELYFESLEAMREGLASPEGEATLADIPHFCDTESLIQVCLEVVKFVWS